MSRSQLKPVSSPDIPREVIFPWFKDSNRQHSANLSASMNRYGSLSRHLFQMWVICRLQRYQMTVKQGLSESSKTDNKGLLSLGGLLIYSAWVSGLCKYLNHDRLQWALMEWFWSAIPIDLLHTLARVIEHSQWSSGTFGLSRVFSATRYVSIASRWSLW